MERESMSLQREFRLAEKSYGADHLDLVLANGYVGQLLSNAGWCVISRSITARSSRNFRR
jgi:hypothetical protein